MLASDLNNPEFIGAVNPDDLLHVEIYWHEPIDKWASEVATQKAGKRVVVKGPKQEYIRIMRPGDKDTIHEVALREDHKVRFPRQYHYWQIAEGLVDGGKDVPGWKLDDWPELDDNAELKRELHFLRFWTVEQIAGAQDAQIQKMGIGGPGLRERARVALKERMRKEFAADLQEKEKEMAAMRREMAELREMVKAKAETPAVEEPVKRGPGRPRKEVTEA